MEQDNKAWSEVEGRARMRMETLPRHDLVREIAVLNKNKMGRRVTSEVRSGNGRKILDILTAPPQWWQGSI